MSISIRQAEPSDGVAIATIYEPFVTDTAITFEETPPTPTEMSQRIAETLARYPYLLAEENSRAVGYSHATAHRARASYRWAVDVAVYLAATHHRRGIGKALYQHLLTILERQGFTGAHAGITVPNPASVGLHESVGFRQIALYRKVGFKLGQWRDVGWWERPLHGQSEPTPAEPIPYAKMPAFKPVILPESRMTS